MYQEVGSFSEFWKKTMLPVRRSEKRMSDKTHDLINDAVKITRFLRENLAKESFCPECQKLIREVFDNHNYRGVGLADPTPSKG